MKKIDLDINGIPANLWGNESDQLFIAIHGHMSNKTDIPILILAEEVVQSGYQLLSFDLPGHGDRQTEQYPCTLQHCIQDLMVIMDYALSQSNNISLFACSMGAYLSLLAYKNDNLKQCLFLSPIVNMQLLLENMMQWFSIAETELEKRHRISTPTGQIIYWHDYCYTKQHPVLDWKNPTSILYGSSDNLCDFNTISSFSDRFNCHLEILNQGEHYFHTPMQLNVFRKWLQERLLK
jgi:uncharacterized protein